MNHNPPPPSMPSKTPQIILPAEELASMMRVCFAGAVGMGRDDGAGERTPTPALWAESFAREEVVSRLRFAGLDEASAEWLADRS